MCKTKTNLISNAAFYFDSRNFAAKLFISNAIMEKMQMENTQFKSNTNKTIKSA